MAWLVGEFKPGGCEVVSYFAQPYNKLLEQLTVAIYDGRPSSGLETRGGLRFAHQSINIIRAFARDT
jgi:hypothetical protein